MLELAWRSQAHQRHCFTAQKNCEGDSQPFANISHDPFSLAQRNLGFRPDDAPSRSKHLIGEAFRQLSANRSGRHRFQIDRHLVTRISAAGTILLPGVVAWLYVFSVE